MDHIYAAADPCSNVDNEQPSGLTPILLDHNFARPPLESPRVIASKVKQAQPSLSQKGSLDKGKKEASSAMSPAKVRRKEGLSSQRSLRHSGDGQSPSHDEAEEEDSEFVPVAMMASAPNSPEGMRSLLAEHLLSATVMPIVSQSSGLRTSSEDTVAETAEVDLENDQEEEGNDSNALSLERNEKPLPERKGSPPVQENGKNQRKRKAHTLEVSVNMPKMHSLLTVGKESASQRNTDKNQNVKTRRTNDNDFSAASSSKTMADADSGATSRSSSESEEHPTESALGLGSSSLDSASAVSGSNDDMCSFQSQDRFVGTNNHDSTCESIESSVLKRKTGEQENPCNSSYPAKDKSTPANFTGAQSLMLNSTAEQAIIPKSSSPIETRRAKAERHSALKNSDSGQQTPVKRTAFSSSSQSPMRTDQTVCVSNSVVSSSHNQSHDSITPSVCESVKLKNRSPTKPDTQSGISNSSSTSSASAGKKYATREACLNISLSLSDEADTSHMLVTSSQETQTSSQMTSTETESPTSTTPDVKKVTKTPLSRKMPKIPKAGPADLGGDVSPFLKPLKYHGWKRELVLRGVYDPMNQSGSKSKRKLPPSDVYYFTPDGKKLRSRVMIADFFKQHPNVHLTVDNFTFIKMPIWEEPWEIVRNAGKHKGRASSGSPGKTSTFASADFKKTTPKATFGGRVRKAAPAPSLRLRSTSRASAVKSLLKIKDMEEVDQDDISDEEYKPGAKDQTPKWSKTRTFGARRKTVSQPDTDNEVLIQSFPEPDIVIDRAEESLYAEEGSVVSRPEGDSSSGDEEGKEADEARPPHMMLLPGDIKVERCDSDESGGGSDNEDCSNVATVHFHHSPPEKCIRPRVKPTARKSTMPRASVEKAKKHKSTDQETPEQDTQLCSSACPGRNGIAPSMQCCVCMCLFHHECVKTNARKSTRTFICPRCKDSCLNQPGDEWPSYNLTSIVPALSTTAVPESSSIPSRTVYVRTPIQASTTLATSAPQPFNANFVVTRPILAVNQEGVAVKTTKNDAIHLLRTLSTLRAPLPTTPQTIRAALNAPPQLVRGGVVPSHLQPVRLIAPLPARALPRLTAAPGVVVSATHQQQQQPPAPVTVITNSSPSVSDVSLLSDSQPQPQMMTLPASLLHRLNLSQPLAVKLNNAQVVVPPSCIISSQDGLKVLLPPSTFPIPPNSNAKLSVTISNNVITTAYSVPTTTTTTTASSGKDSPLGGTSSTASSQDKSVNGGHINMSEVPSRRCRRQNLQGVEVTQCAIHRLHGGFDCMLAIFHYLGVKDLLRASQVCRTWLKIARQSCLWLKVSLKGLRVVNWERATDFLHSVGNKHLCLQSMQLQLFGDSNAGWELQQSELSKHLKALSSLSSIQFGLVSSAVLHQVTESLTQLQVLHAEHISDFYDEKMWVSKTKLDFGKFSKLSQLQELRLHGVSGLALPTFTFSGSLSELGHLKHLHTLSLTSLYALRDSDFQFLRGMQQLEVLELGDCLNWTSQTYSVLGELQNLHHLRLECGGEIPDIGVGEAISRLTKLKRLELILFAIPASMESALCQLPVLETLVIWPDTSHGIMPAVVNSHALTAVVNLTQLKSLVWGVVIKNNQQEHRSGSPLANKLSTIPLLRPGSTLAPQVERRESDVMDVSVNQFMEKLLIALPKSTNIKVFNTHVVGRDNM